MNALARATRLLHVDRVPALVGLVLLLTSLAITAVGLGAPVDVPSCAFTKAVLCAELPASGSELARVLASAPNTPGDWALTTWIDMLLLVAYGALLVLGARRLGGARPGLARAVVALAVVGAALDVLENSGTLVAVGRVVDGAGAQVGDGLAALVAFAARAKFTALGLACAGIAVLAWPLRRRHVVVVGLLALGGAVALGASLVGWGWPRLIELGGTGIAVTLLGLWLAALGGALLRARQGEVFVPMLAASNQTTRSRP